MTQATATIILDSISTSGKRLTTFQLRYWRPIHSELMTHRVFSRNAGSSRARPAKAIIEQVRENPWGPLHWGKNQPGMQASKQLDSVVAQFLKVIWDDAAKDAANRAEVLSQNNLHKQAVNRILEPYTYIDVVVTATDYANWFALRNHEDAQPEIQDLAQKMLDAMQKSKPQPLRTGEWHLPYILPEDYTAAHNYLMQQGWSKNLISDTEINTVLLKISVARCARVSYKAFDGTTAPISKDMELYEQLLVSEPLHASPAEHQATPDEASWIQTIAVGDPDDPEDTDENVLNTYKGWLRPELHGNFDGWIQYRKMIPNEFTPG